MGFAGQAQLVKVEERLVLHSVDDDRDRRIRPVEAVEPFVIASRNDFIRAELPGQGEPFRATPRQDDPRS